MWLPHLLPKYNRGPPGRSGKQRGRRGPRRGRKRRGGRGNAGAERRTADHRGRGALPPMHPPSSRAPGAGAPHPGARPPYSPLGHPWPRLAGRIPRAEGCAGRRAGEPGGQHEGWAWWESSRCENGKEGSARRPGALRKLTPQDEASHLLWPRSPRAQTPDQFSSLVPNACAAPAHLPCASHCCASLNALRCAEGGLLCAGEEPEALGLGVHGGHIGQWASPRLLLHSPLTLLLSADTLPTVRPSETPR